LEQLREIIKNPDRLILSLRAKYRIHPKTEQAIRDLCAMDQDLYKRYSGLVFAVPEYARGPINFLFEMLCRADVAHDASEKQSQKLDEAGIVKYSATYNGASAENIGSHSLIAKDSKNKRPLYPQALNLAKRVATYVAEVMIRQVNRRQVAAARFELDAAARGGTGKPATTLTSAPCVDWLHLLQHFICHPSECESDWHLEAMKDHTAPTYHVVKYADWSTVKKRIKLERLKNLALLYRDHGREVECDWLKVADKEKK
jgi:hypothetical protein